MKGDIHMVEYAQFSDLVESEQMEVEGGKGIVNVVGGVTAVAGVVGCVFPPAFLVAGVGGMFLVGYGIGEAIRG